MNKYLCVYEYYETTEIGIIFAETKEKAQIMFAITKCQELSGEGGLWLSDTYKDIDDVKEFCKKLKDTDLLNDYIKVYNIDEVKENSTIEYIQVPYVDKDGKQRTYMKKQFMPLGSEGGYSLSNTLKRKLITKD